MGYVLVGEVFDAAPSLDLTPTERLTLLTLAHFANDSTGRQAFPRMDTVSAITGLSLKTIYLATRSLEAKGLVTSIGGKHKYRCVIADLKSVTTTDSVVPIVEGRSVTMTDKVSHHDRPSRSPRPTESVTMTAEPRSNPEENREENPATYGRSEEIEIASVQPCKRDNEQWSPGSLAEHLHSRVMLEMREHGGHPTGAVNKRALASRLIKVMKQFELTPDELHDLMHVYAKSTTVWNPKSKHPAWDFLSSNTLSRLVNMTRPSRVEYYNPVDTTQSSGYLRLMAAAEAAKEQQ